ncbi:WXG100 family type VII secretion target [Frondihabitans australicus]|uniref:WXG100 family type VII secretion target n=1 Tax=Frondihabitans australicus TaxID=386892 RepID=A0A495IL08_9MICO|nr:WXG100 family type VII secretion target [Frondihabitans australicus]RKR76410.1 WXG100 family type VII secretion target [Frondihabitans australicus]
MAGYEVDLDRLAAVQRDVQALVEHCALLRSEIDATARALTETDWTGDASATFAELQQQWAAGAATIHAGLDVMAANASTGHANYSAVQAANARLWGV